MAHKILLELKRGDLHIETAEGSTIKFHILEKPHADNNFEVGNEAELRFEDYEVDDLIAALEFLKR